MTTKHTRQALENILFESLENSNRLSVDNFASWLLHRAHRPDEYGEDKANACATAWHLLIQYKQENGI